MYRKRGEREFRENRTGSARMKRFAKTGREGRGDRRGARPQGEGGVARHAGSCDYASTRGYQDTLHIHMLMCVHAP